MTGMNEMSAYQVILSCLLPRRRRVDRVRRPPRRRPGKRFAHPYDQRSPYAPVIDRIAVTPLTDG